MTDAIDLRLEEAQSEMKHLREALKRANERVGKAEEALRFYANVKNYAVNNEGATGLVFQNRVIDDFEKVDVRTHVAGRRARLHFAEYAE